MTSSESTRLPGSESLFCDLTFGRKARLVSASDPRVPDWAEGTALAIPHTREAFGCEVPHANPPTPNRVRPDVRFTRKVFTNGEMAMPDGRRIEYWGFEDPASNVRRPFPSAPIRVREGQVVHTVLESSKGPHTIHHHGVDSIPFNDGVGHTSFEVTGSYTYQWRAASAGTYIYHCHRNTVLHFEMGMYGLLIVDPSTGPGLAYTDGPAYDVEGFHVIDDVDPSWRGRSHGAGLCGGDEGFDDFRPKYFVINGVPHPRSLGNATSAVRARVGQRILLRHVNASYSLVRTTVFGLDAEIVAIDGRPLRPPESSPIALPAGQPMATVSSQRHDLILRPTLPGAYRIRNEFIHWISGSLLGVAETMITVTV